MTWNHNEASEMLEIRKATLDDLAAVMWEGESAGLHTVIARIAEGNEASVRLYESGGFGHIGIMRQVGRKFGKLLDVHMMQKIFR